MVDNFGLTEEKMIKARKLGFFISVMKAIVFFVFDLLLVLVVFGYFFTSGISSVAVSLFSLAVIFFKLIDFLKKIAETKQKLG